MEFSKRFSTEELEELQWLLTHRAFRHVLNIIDETVQNIEREVVTFPTSGTPQDAMLGLNNKRHQAIGASSLRNALKAKINDLRLKMEEGECE